MSNNITKNCPNCGSLISFEANALHATCSSCDQSFKTSELMNPGASAADNAIIDMANMLANFDSPESGLIYIESVFANYDWEAYYSKPEVLIGNIQQMIDKNNMKAGAIASTWYLDFLSLATPIVKKIEGLNILGSKIGAKYDKNDASAVLADFDNYKKVVKHLVVNKEKYFNRLNNDIAFATKLGLETAKVKEMKEKLKLVASLYVTLPETVEAVNDIELRTIPSVAVELAKADEAIAALYAAKGIDAPASYQNALDLYEVSGQNKNPSLELFSAIKDYKNSADYINKINKYFDFDGEMFNFLGKNFIFKLNEGKVEEGEEVVNPKDKGKGKKGEEEEYVGKTHELFEVVGEKPAHDPIIKRITQVLTVYANKLFYIKNGNTIAAYDFSSGTEKEIYKPKKDDLKLDGNYFFNNGNSKMFVVHNMAKPKIGCLRLIINKILSIFSKKKDDGSIKNSISVMQIDLANDEVKDIIDEAYNLYANGGEYTVLGDYIFYLVADDIDKNDLLHRRSVRTYNIETGEHKVVLEDAYSVNYVAGSKVVYSVLFPNKYNKQLRVHDIETDADIVIEDNIYNFQDVLNGRIFYTVGNKEFSPLYSNNFEGTDRVEVMRQSKKILACIGNWLYIERYSAYYGKDVVMKVSLDGKQKIVLCANFKQSVKITDEYFYFINKYNELCVVNGMGGDLKIIAFDIDKKNIIVDDKNSKIFYLRKEIVGGVRPGSTSNRKNYSLYVMDIDGAQARKVLFDVTAMKNYDKDTLYIKRNERCAFVLEKPDNIKKKKSSTPEVAVLDIVRFYKLNKSTLENVLELTIGMPDAKYEAKAGCMKKEDKDVIFIQLPRNPDFIENEVEFEEEDPYLVKQEEDDKNTKRP